MIKVSLTSKIVGCAIFGILFAVGAAATALRLAVDGITTSSPDHFIMLGLFASIALLSFGHMRAYRKALREKSEILEPLPDLGKMPFAISLTSLASLITAFGLVFFHEGTLMPDAKAVFVILLFSAFVFLYRHLRPGHEPSRNRV